MNNSLVDGTKERNKIKQIEATKKEKNMENKKLQGRKEIVRLDRKKENRTERGSRKEDRKKRKVKKRGYENFTGGDQ